jgi:hypothetical protein
MLYIIGSLLILSGAASYMTRWTFSPYIYIVGACLFAVAQFLDRSPIDDFVIRRLQRQQLFGALFLICAGAFMLFLHRNEWIVALTIGAVIELYTVFRLDSEEKKHTS